MNTVNQIKLGAVLSYIGIAINIIAGLVYTPWMVSSIGKENFGLYTLAMSVITLFVFDFGLSSSITRYISVYLAENKQAQIYKFLGLISRLYLVIDIVLLVCLSLFFFFIPIIYKQLTLAELEKFEIVYIMTAFYSVLSFPFIPLNGILTAYEKFVQLKFCDMLHKLLIVALMSGALLMGGGLYSLVFVNIISGIVCIVIKLLCIKKYTNIKLDISSSKLEDLKEIISFSGWVTIVSIAQRCIMNIAPSILGICSGSIGIAILGIAITLEGYTYTFANALNGMFLPKVSRLLADGSDKILPLMIRVGRIQIYIVGLVVFGFLIFGKEFILLWMGNGFKDCYYCAVLLILPSFFHLPQIIGSQVIYASNKVKYTAIVYLISALVNIGLAFILAPIYGAFGVALSICIVYLLRTLGLDYIFWKKLNIDVVLFFKETYLRLCSFFFLFVLVSSLINYYPTNSWIILFVKIFVSTILYAIILYYMAFNDYEKDLFVRSILKYVKSKV